MKKYFAVPSLLGSFLLVSLGHAADLKQSTFTQVINDVQVVSAANSSERPAVVNAMFNMPDLVRTGADSRAELVAEDKTITRVGANTIFSFDPANRTINLQQGSLLFHSPKGMGGGTIRTSSATAAVLGTTLIVTTTRSGGFKVIDLEGHVAIKFLSGVHQDLNPGQMTFVLAGGRPAPVLTIRLDTLTKDSHLVQGFAAPLPSMPLIQQQVDTQVKEIQSGQAQDTGLLVGDNATSNSVQVVKVDPATIADVQQASTNGPAGSVPIDTPTLDSSLVTYFSGSTGVSSTGTIAAFTAPIATPDIFINTPTIDLSPYASQASGFEFIAPGNITINKSVAFNGLPANSNSFLALVADDQLLITPGSTVEADVGIFALIANGQNGMTLNGVNILNNDPMGSIVIDSPSIVINGGSLQAPSEIELLGGNIALSNPSLISTGFLFVDATTGSINVTGGHNGGGGGGGGGGNGNFQVGNVTLVAGDTISLDGSSQNPVAGQAQPFVFNMTAANLIQVQNLDFGGFQTVNMTAHTINLANIDFSSGSVVRLTSHFNALAGGPNTNQASVPGDVNFISGVNYNGQPAQGHLVASGPGIIIAGGAP
ncbi:MAG TPA: FecR family protein [Opitutaceae bacterium]|jgi:hypothetical protein|nr:FecR family protein [Opitutaceae bacterium]